MDVLKGGRPLTVGGDRLIVEPRRSCGPMLECRRVGNPLPGVPPGEEAHDGAMRIFGVIKVLSDSRRLGNALATRRKLLSGDDGEQPNHQPPSIPEPVNKRTAKIKNIQNNTLPRSTAVTFHIHTDACMYGCAYRCFVYPMMFKEGHSFDFSNVCVRSHQKTFEKKISTIKGHKLYGLMEPTSTTRYIVYKLSSSIKNLTASLLSKVYYHSSNFSTKLF